MFVIFIGLQLKILDREKDGTRAQGGERGLHLSAVAIFRAEGMFSVRLRELSTRVRSIRSSCNQIF